MRRRWRRFLRHLIDLLWAGLCLIALAFIAAAWLIDKTRRMLCPDS